VIREASCHRGHYGQEFLIVNAIPMTEKQYRDGSKIQ
jgi:hypothetical protein